MTLAEESEKLDTLNNLYQLQITLELMEKNLSLYSRDPNSKIVTVSNTSLYRLAEDYYGDATKWTTIAKENGLTDPQITDTMTLKIPNSPEDNGGILEY